MKKHSLEISLQALKKPEHPIPELEQYTTPADVAADLLWTALSFGDIQGRAVADLGCGSGILGIGAKMLGAKSVTCLDVDHKLILLTEENAKAAGVQIETVCAEVSTFKGNFDTVIQNPPFGAQRRGADRPFVKTATSIARTTYSFHLTETLDFLTELCGALGAQVQHIKSYKFKIPFMFEFHRKPAEYVDVSLLRITKDR